MIHLTVSRLSHLSSDIIISMPTSLVYLSGMPSNSHFLVGTVTMEEQGKSQNPAIESCTDEDFEAAKRLQRDWSEYAKKVCSS